MLDSEGAFMIEWPQRIASILPPDCLWIELTYLNELRRSLRFVATKERSTKLLRQFSQRAFGI